LRRSNASIFYPARLKVGARLKEMPRKCWKNLPEAALIPELVAGAEGREAAMLEQGKTLFAEEGPKSLSAVAEQIQVCRRCPIGCNGTNAVAGEGPQRAALMVVGEQPGDKEEELGRPFIGPAGLLLRSHLDDAGIEDKSAYVTNAVKHFKFVQRGKRRLHQSPTAGEIDICRWWLESEREIVRPQVVLALGASAARGMLGKTVGVQKVRGEPLPLQGGGELWITTHPSFLLRLQDEGKAMEERKFAADLRKVARRLAELAER
jgi:DNA polymerase